MRTGHFFFFFTFATLVGKLRDRGLDFSGRKTTMSALMSQPVMLRCEYFTNPLGIDVLKPKLCWQISDARRGARQTAYQIVVSDRSGQLWDSGKVHSDQNIHVIYEGPPLRSRQRCEWKVRIWDQEGKPSEWSEQAWWEMGLLNRSDWVAQWIGSWVVGGPRTMAPAPYLRKEFIIDRPVANARLYVTALGLYEFEINGQPVGDYVFAPGRTDYRYRVQYQVYDVTSLLQSGTNAMGAILGDGWYCGHIHSDPRQYYGDRPRLFAQLMIDCADGTTRVIATDNTWKTSTGPIRSSDLLMGEDYDARLEMPGWSKPGFDDSKWQAVEIFPDPGIAIVAMRSPPVRRIQELKPISPPVRFNRRRWIFDLGQNMVGRVRIRINGPAGAHIVIRHAEMLDKDGSLYTQALRTARATDYYTKKSDEEEVYEPHFTFHGFRYVEVKGISGEPTADTLRGIVLHSGITPTGSFECSDPLVNRLQQNIVWSQKGNFLEIPTDCPQRDERLGWTGDAQVFIRTAAFNMDVAGFFTKWLRDMADAQGPDGRIPSVVPDCPSIYGEGGPAWADAAIICPWTIWQCYGDRRILEDCWPMMTRFMDFLQANCRNFIRADEHWKWKGYGDWLSIDAHTPHDLIGTAFYAYCAKLMSSMAKALRKYDQAEKYQRLFEDVRRAWQKRFIQPDGSIVGKTQTAYVLALHFDLVPAELRPRVMQDLVSDIESRGMHLSTGFVGTPYLNQVLTDNGRADVAYALLLQKTCPSWLYPVTQGATTIWERWDGWTQERGFNDAGMNSYNHYAYGAVGAWMYAYVAGIQLDPDQPGYKHIIICPHIGGGLTCAKASLNCMYGLIESSWQVEGNLLHLNVTIPANTTATIHIPTADVSKITESGQSVTSSVGLKLVRVDGPIAVFDAEAGKYAFVSQMP